MSSNNGILNEIQIASLIDGRKLSQINLNLQTMLRMIFPDANGNDVIEAKHLDDVYKPDIYVQYKGKKRFISVKMGHTTEVHSEEIHSVINFLKIKGVSQETLDTILLHHYGDGTLDGTGTKRFNTMELTFMYADRIKRANDELNSSYDLIMDVFHRTMIQGLDPLANSVDYFYFGTPDYGNLVCYHQISTYIHKKAWGYFNCLHIGPFFLKPRARYVDKEIVSEYRRNLCVFYWPNLAEDIDYLGHRFTFVNKK